MSDISGTAFVARGAVVVCSIAALLLFAPAFAAPVSSSLSSNPAARPQACGPAAAQGGFVSLLRPEQWLDFKKALEEISRQAKVTVLAEGVPFATQLPLGTAAIPASAMSPLTAEQALEKLAALYDYDLIEPQRPFADGKTPRLFLLKKRYSDPRDLPAVTLEEYRQSLQETIQILQAAVGSSPAAQRYDTLQAEGLRSLLGSLSPAQWQQLDSEEGLPLPQLSGVQRQPLEKVLLSAHVGFPLGLARQDLAWLEKAPGIVFLRKERADEGVVLGFEAPQKGFWPVHLVRGQSAPEVSIARQRQKPAPWTQSLQSLTDEVNRRSGEARGSDQHSHAGVTGKQFLMDPVLSERPITAVGLEYSTGEQVFAALAAHFELRHATIDGKTHRLLRRTLRHPRSLAQLPLALRQAMPEPLVRALHEQQPPPVPPQLGQQQEQKPLLPNRADRIGQAALVLTALGAETTQHLKEEVEPRLLALAESTEKGVKGQDQQQTKPAVVALASLPARARSAFALQMMMDYLSRAVRELTQEPPPFLDAYINRFEQAFLKRQGNSLAFGANQPDARVGTAIPKTWMSVGLPKEYHLPQQQP